MDPGTRNLQHCFMLTLLAATAASTIPLNAFMQFTGLLTALAALVMAAEHRRAFHYPGSEHARVGLWNFVFTILFIAGTAWFAGLLYVIVD